MGRKCCCRCGRQNGLRPWPAFGRVLTVCVSCQQAIWLRQKWGRKRTRDRKTAAG